MSRFREFFVTDAVAPICLTYTSAPGGHVPGVKTCPFPALTNPVSSPDTADLMPFSAPGIRQPAGIKKAVPKDSLISIICAADQGLGNPIALRNMSIFSLSRLLPFTVNTSM